MEKILPAATKPQAVSEASQEVAFNLDGTLSMQGFARAGDGRFSQLLQDLDLSLTSVWKPDRINYYRFGSIIEPVAQRPFYVAASNENFFKATRNYAATRIDNVFRASKPGRLTLIMTDLFEQDLDIGSIQQALKAASFPNRSSLAIWQWNMPFRGAIFDFDFRVHQGREYSGSRYLYMLALGAKDSIEQLRASIDRNVTAGKPNFLLLSDQPVKAGPDWLKVTQTKNVALKSRSLAAGNAVPYSVYRLSRGCATASLTARPQLTPSADGSPSLANPGSYSAALYAVAANNGKWSSRALPDPGIRSTAERSGVGLITIDLTCADVTASPLTLLRVSRVGTGNDLLLPPWVAASSSSSMDFNNAVKRKEPGWGQKTLNLLPFVRGLASAATEQNPLAIAYIYLVDK